MRSVKRRTGYKDAPGLKQEEGWMVVTGTKDVGGPYRTESAAHRIVNTYGRFFKEGLRTEEVKIT
jgi:hypothetical protein